MYIQDKRYPNFQCIKKTMPGRPRRSGVTGVWESSQLFDTGKTESEEGKVDFKVFVG